MAGDLQPGRYRHYKGRDYQVLGVARHCGAWRDSGKS